MDKAIYKGIPMATLPILLVDDNRESCDLLAQCLSIFGYPTDVAYDGPAALKLIRQKEYGLTISDYQMPGMNGIDLIRSIRRERADLPGLLLTGYPKDDVEELALEAGIHHVLSKPADFHELIPLIERCLAS
jgi:CheY-like chemotaxis protein